MVWACPIDNILRKFEGAPNMHDNTVDFYMSKTWPFATLSTKQDRSGVP